MKTMVVTHGGRARIVEDVKGPTKWFANSETERYTGLLMPEPLDPYGEPYTISFTKDQIIREA